ncbi:unnamed protein product [Symbiodinium sp. CCMP2456]|nr:unnamed protein product [Symbiodinium sp. CCMP2456]
MKSNAIVAEPHFKQLAVATRAPGHAKHCNAEKLPEDDISGTRTDTSSCDEERESDERSMLEESRITSDKSRRNPNTGDGESWQAKQRTGMNGPGDPDPDAGAADPAHEELCKNDGGAEFKESETDSFGPV